MSTQKDWPKHFSKAFKFFLILILRRFRRKGHGFFNPWFSFFTMFSSNKVSFIITFIFRRWVIKINNRFYFDIILRVLYHCLAEHLHELYHYHYHLVKVHYQIVSQHQK